MNTQWVILTAARLLAAGHAHAAWVYLHSRDCFLGVARLIATHHLHAAWVALERAHRALISQM